MAKETRGRTTSDAINATARYVRRSAEAIRARATRVGEPVSEWASERLALCEWAELNGKRLPFEYIRQFKFDPL